MIGAIGLTLTLIGLVSALGGAIAAAGAYRGRLRIRYAEIAATAAALTLLGANFVMLVALVGHDFSVAYVAQVGSRSTPLLYTISSLWGAQEGSLLFWSGLLAGFAAAVATPRLTADPRIRATALVVLLGLVAFFASLVVGPADPWARVVPAPADGPGPNPLLASHPLMAIHPPLLYLGLVGLAVPFALTVAALLVRRLDAAWARRTRRWTLVAWVFLTLGLMTGAWWSYAVLGWGGYWAWDPVENVALLPWLTSTALLHSTRVGGERMTTWNVALVAASFVLTIVATLVTRSGVLESVHAFTRTPIGPLFLILLVVILVGTVGLVLVRPPTDRGGRMGARSRGFLLNNLLLMAMAAAVLFGTVFPILAEALTATRVSVGAPYFERMVGPLGLGLLILVGIGPTLADGAWTDRHRTPLVVAASGALLVALLVFVADGGPAAVAGTSAASFVVFASVLHLAGRALRPRGASVYIAGQARAAGLVSHLGVGLLALALVLSSAGRREDVATMRVGGEADLVGLRVELIDVVTTAGAPGRAEARITVLDRDGGSVELSPGLALHPQAAIALPAIVAGPISDLYVTALNIDPATDSATLRVGLHPFTSWLWPAGAVIALGGLLSLRPGRRSEQVQRTEPMAAATIVGDG